MIWWKTARLLFGGVGFIIGVYMAVDAWVIMRAETVTKPIEQRMMAVRDADTHHFEGRFDRVEHKLDEIKAIIQEKR